jgi:hypothetical protein
MSIPARLAAALLIAAPSICSASPIQVMKFENMALLENDGLYIEDGITATYYGTLNGYDAVVGRTAGGVAGFNGVYLSTDALFADFTTGSLFEPISLDLRPLGSDYCAAAGFSEPIGISPSAACPTFDDPINYIWFIGSVNGVVVSTMSLYQRHSEAFSTISLSSLGVIDTLRIEPRGYYELGLTGACPVGVGCGRFYIDNLTVRSVPEPGTLLLLSSALGGLALTRRRRAK